MRWQTGHNRRWTLFGKVHSRGNLSLAFDSSVTGNSEFLRNADPQLSPRPPPDRCQPSAGFPIVQFNRPCPCHPNPDPFFLWFHIPTLHATKPSFSPLSARFCRKRVSRACDRHPCVTVTTPRLSDCHLQLARAPSRAAHHLAMRQNPCIRRDLRGFRRTAGQSLSGISATAGHPGRHSGH